MGNLFRIAIILLALGFNIANAATDDESFFTDSPSSFPTQSSALHEFYPLRVSGPVLSPNEIFERTQAVLNYFNVPELPSNDGDLSKFHNLQSSKGLQKLLPFIDANNNFPKLFTLTTSRFFGFDDLNNKTSQDFAVQLRPNGFRYNRIHIPNFAFNRVPLKGIKIAIDPGHMGEQWDKKTGKYIHDGKGNYLSEGIMALQVSLLLKKEFEELGAEVLLTRTTPDAVSKIPYEGLEIQPYAKNELRESAHQPWFQSLLTAGTGQKLYDAFKKSTQVKKIFAESSRYTYFILREDLWARADVINEFQPDITLIVHFDVVPAGNDGHGLNPKAPKHTKVYIAGGFLNGELASRNTRKQFAKKLLDQKQWDDSVKLGQKIVDQFTRQMGLTTSSSSGGGKAVAPGIFSRNLGLTRSIDHSAIAYLECLFYNRPEEFQAFTNYKYDMYINGKNYPYSDRLKQVVSSIKQGVLNYAK